MNSAPRHVTEHRGGRKWRCSVWQDGIENSKRCHAYGQGIPLRIDMWQIRKNSFKVALAARNNRIMFMHAATWEDAVAKTDDIMERCDEYLMEAML